MQKYLKAIAAALTAGATALTTALDDGNVTAQEGVIAAFAVLAACGVTWAVPNKQTPGA
ncbi:hypothetical protein ACN2WE_21530 [Streptomyces sp. cg28]|uniref:hypothetical protein n=1 Tax=Streptomyces sp. cg28 TaxID=3403457 RepID=UPI003B213E16